MTKLDYIIVGQGIAGTTLAFRMIKAGLMIRVIDPGMPVSGSLVAAGIVNPITGRKLVKTWMIDELLIEVESLYREMEELIGDPFLTALPIYKLLNSVKDQNDWMARRLDAAYEPYMSEINHPDWVGINSAHGIGVIQDGFWLRIGELITAYRKHLTDTGILIRQTFDYTDLDISKNDGVTYGDLKARRVVFCEGYQGKLNPFFEGLPLSFAKGEIMTIQCPSLHWLDGILNRNGFIIPLGENKFRVGATFRWNDLSDEVSEKGKADLVSRLENLTSLDYEVVETQAGFRPTVSDRRPLLGKSSLHPSLYIFNGLGTKGVSLAAYFSNHLLRHLEEGQDIMAEVDIRRFKTYPDKKYT